MINNKTEKDKPNLERELILYPNKYSFSPHCIQDSHISFLLSHSLLATYSLLLSYTLNLGLDPIPRQPTSLSPFLPILRYTFLMGPIIVNDTKLFPVDGKMGFNTYLKVLFLSIISFALPCHPISYQWTV